MNTNKENTPRQENVSTSIAQIPQYSNPAWKALWLAYESQELDLDSYLTLCNDFHFLPF